MFEGNQRGVRGTQRLEVAPAGVKPNSLIGMMPIEQFGVRYVDGDGNIHNTVIVRAAGAYYEPQNAEAWANSLRPVNTWLADLLLVQDKLGAAPIPKDAVDVGT